MKNRHNLQLSRYIGHRWLLLSVIGFGLLLFLAWSKLGDYFPGSEVYTVVFAVFGMVIALPAIRLFNRAIGKTSPHGARSEVETANSKEVEKDQIWEIHESEEVQRSLAEAFGDVVIHRDHKGKITFSNEPFAKYFGTPSNAVLPTPQARLAEEDGAPPKARQVKLETLQGERWFAWTDLTTRDPHTGKSSLSSVARDITEQKITEHNLLEAANKSEIANNAKSRFLAMVSHEIRTPLNGVMGMAQLLNDTELQPAQRSYVEAMLDSGRTLDHLINDLLDTVQIESGHTELTIKPTQLNVLVEDVAEILASEARANGLALATSVDPSIPETVMTDSGRLRQVLINLAGNAIKFTRKGGVAIHVRRADTSNSAEDCVELEFLVVDSGPGIDEADQDKIFEEFAQIEDGATRNYGGAGLGLAISQSLVQLMGGDIRVKSQPDSGSRFSFNIKVSGEGPSRLDVVQTDSTVVLLLPDTPARQAIAESIQYCGYKTLVFDDIATLTNHTFKKGVEISVITAHEEINSSIKTLRQLRRFLRKKAKLLLLGDAVQRQSVEKLITLGYDGWLTWPVRLQTLAKVISGRANADKISSPKTSALPIEQSRKLHVLLAEDNPVNALLAKALFSKLGHRLTHVEDGQSAVDKAKEIGPFDVIFMDLHMPILDGATAIQKIRAQEAQRNSARCPIVVLSADGQSTARDAAISAGADDFLIKPLDLEVLKQLLHSIAEQPKSAATA